MLIRPCDDPRLLEGLRHSCGPLFMDALENPDVIEIMLNPDGSLWIEKYGQDHGPEAPAPAQEISPLHPAGRFSLQVLRQAL